MKRIVAGAALALSAAGCAVSTQQEVALGADYARQVDAQLPIATDPEINRYINVLGDSIAKLSDERNLDWRFRVVNSKEVNAFAIPGGFIYVNRGLIERAENLAMLAGVIGHEIAHVTERHAVEQMQNAQKANLGVTLACILTRVCNNQASQALLQVGGSAVFAKFSRDAEREADAKAVRYVMRAGIDPRGIPAMFRTLLEERRRQPAGVEAWFSTHPLEEERIETTEKLLSHIDPAILETLTTNTRNFEAFKERVSALPLAPREAAGRR